MKNIVYLLLILLLSSCGKKDGDSNILPPKDTSKPSPYPYSVRYGGTMRNQSFNAPSLIPNNILDFDTTYQTVLTVQYPDSSNIRLSFSFWDYKDTTLRGTYVLYSFEQMNTYPKAESGYYVANSRHHYTYYTLRGDSLLVTKEDFERAGDYYRHVSFAGAEALDIPRCAGFVIPRNMVPDLKSA